MRLRTSDALVALVLVSAAQPASAQDARPATRITALVLDESGAPIAGAGFAFGGPPELTTDDVLDRPLAKSGRDGRVDLALPNLEGILDAGDFALLVVAAPGRIAATYGLRRSDLSGRHFDLGAILLFPGVDLRGRVRDAHGAPVAGVLVEARPLVERIDSNRTFDRHEASTRTDAEGIFLLRGALPTSCVRFSKDGFAAEVVEPVRRDSPLSPILRELGWVRGRIDGDLPEHTEVIVQSEGQALDSDVRAPVAADGSFRAPRNGDGRFRVFCAKPGWSFSEPAVFSSTAEPVVLSLPRTPPLPQLRLDVTAGDKPVAAFRVLALQDGTRNGRSYSEGEETFPTPATHPWTAIPVITGRDGVALIDATEDQRPGFLVSAEGLATTRVRFSTGEIQVACPMEPGATLTGRVLDAEQKPIAGALVFAVRASKYGSYERPPSGARTDDEGRYRIDGLPADEYLVQADADGFEYPDLVPVEVLSGATATVADIVVWPARPLRGRVRGHAVLPGARVSVSKWRSIDLRYGMWERQPMATLDPEGNFELVLRRRQRTRLVLVLPSRSLDTGTELELGWLGPDDPPRDFDLDSMAMTRLQGRVVLLGGPASQRDLLLSVSGSPAAEASIYLDASDRFDLTLPGERWLITVDDVRTGLTLKSVELKRDAMAKDKPIDLEVPMRTVVLRLVQPSTEPRLEVSQLRFESHRFPGVGRRYGVPVAHGQVEFKVGLPLDTISIRAENGFGDRLAEVSLNVTANSPVTFDLKLKTPASLR